MRLCRRPYLHRSFIHARLILRALAYRIKIFCGSGTEPCLCVSRIRGGKVFKLRESPRTSDASFMFARVSDLPQPTWLNSLSVSHDVLLTMYNHISVCGRMMPVLQKLPIFLCTLYLASSWVLLTHIHTCLLCSCQKHALTPAPTI